MATTSTIPTIKAQIVSLLAARPAIVAAGVSVTYAWPGPAGAAGQIFFGELPREDQALPVVKAGRVSRQENYTLDLVVQSFHAELTSEMAAIAEAIGFALLAEVEGMLADSPTLGLAAGAIQWANVEGLAVRLVPFETGWLSEIVVSIAVKARLT